LSSLSKLGSEKNRKKKKNRKWKEQKLGLRKNQFLEEKPQLHLWPS
jgi:hypothetical protein